MNGRTNSTDSRANNVQIPLNAPTTLVAITGNAQVSLSWTDPKDKYATPEGETAQDPQQLVSVWSFTRVIRKAGSEPVSPNDGVVVIDSAVRNQYESTPFVDTGVTNNTLYYYALFAYNEDMVYSNPVISDPVTPKIGTPASELTEGTIVKVNENGAPVEFYLAKHNYEERYNGPGKELLVRKDIYTLGRFGSSARAALSNNYVDNDLDIWCDQTYINVFSSWLKSRMGTTTIEAVTAVYNTTIGDRDPYDKDTVKRHAWVLSIRELDRDPVNPTTEGSALPVANQIVFALYNGKDRDYWTRSAQFISSSVYVINKGSGTDGTWVKSIGEYSGRRPCIAIPSNLLFDENLELVEQ